MPLATWPVGLPFRPDQRMLKRSRAREALSTEVEDGPPIMRVQSQTLIRRMTYSIMFSAAQKQIWETFVEVTLKQGTQHFIMDVPLVTATYVPRRCYIEGGKWEDEDIGVETRVSFTLCAFVAELPPP